MTQTFSVRCPGCSSRLKFKDQKLLGRQVNCPKCKHAFTVPKAPAAGKPQPPSALDDEQIVEDDPFATDDADFGNADFDEVGEVEPDFAESPSRGRTPPRPGKSRRGSGSGGRSGKRKTPQKSSALKWILPAAIAGGVLLIGVCGVVGWLVWPDGDDGAAVVQADPSSPADPTASEPPGMPDVPATGPGAAAPSPVSPPVAAGNGTNAETEASPAAANPAASVEIKFVRIPAGTFRMGSDKQGESPAHDVTLTQDFEMSATEITQGQWEAVMQTKPWKTELNLGEFGLGGLTIEQVGGAEAVMAQLKIMQGPNYPASNITWEEAVEFCKRLSEREGVTYRLPTEAEWEYACRGGTTTAYSFGDDPELIGEYAWYRNPRVANNDEKFAHEVATKQPNPWGLYDMHGNLSEWCQDAIRDYAEEPVVDPFGPIREGTLADLRCLRGGDFKSSPNDSRSSQRGQLDLDHRTTTAGFRVVRVPADGAE